MGKPVSKLLEILTTQSPAAKVIRARMPDQGLADSTHLPFLAMVGQYEMKLALTLALINRQIGGLLLIGPRGTGKTTAVRGLTELMPSVRRSLCVHGCEEEAAFNLGIDAVCGDCAIKIGHGEPITRLEPMRLNELPLNARLEDVVGGVNERVALEQNKISLTRGILSNADQNLLYIDEVNLLDDAIINAILDASAQGVFTVRRGPLAATYRSRIFLVGSMNPEEGGLRPQIQDRFGLRVIVRTLESEDDRLEAYRRSIAFRQNPHKFIADWQHMTVLTRADIQNARDLLPSVGFVRGVERTGIRWIQQLKIESQRSEIALFEAARAYAAADQRDKVNLRDLRIVASMALRQRQSEFITRYIETQAEEDRQLQEIIQNEK
jgi:magnesium chelatase subunit I